MAKLSDYLKKDLINLELQGTTKDEIIRELALMVKDKVSDFDKFLEAVYERESAGSTALEHGLCIPHAKCKYVNEFCIAVGCKKEGVDCDSLDSKKSTVFFLIAGNDNTRLEHLGALVKISQIVSDDTATELLSNTKSREGFIDIIRKLEMRWQIFVIF